MGVTSCVYGTPMSDPTAESPMERMVIATLLSPTLESETRLRLAQQCSSVGSLSRTRPENLSGFPASLLHPLLLEAAILVA